MKPGQRSSLSDEAMLLQGDVHPTKRPGPFALAGFSLVAISMITPAAADTVPPDWSVCPPSQIRNGAPNSVQAFWTAPTASDNVGVTRTTATHNSGATFPLGVTTVTYTSFDAANNSGTCSFTITVRDVTPPVIAGRPANITVGTDAGIATALVAWTAPTATDNAAVTSFTSTHSSGDVFALGTTTVTYTASDASGNVGTASFTVTVKDLEAPRILGMPADITRYVPPGQTSVEVTWPPPTATDNVAVTRFLMGRLPSNAFGLGVATVIYTARDAAGNTSTASFTVTVIVGTEPPSLRQVPALGTLATLALAALLSALAMARIGAKRRH